jgi:hypothetical protein
VGLITDTCGAAYLPSASIRNYSQIFLESDSIYAGEMIFNSIGKPGPWDLFAGNSFRIEGKPDNSLWRKTYACILQGKIMHGFSRPQEPVHSFNTVISPIWKVLSPTHSFPPE